MYSKSIAHIMFDIYEKLAKCKAESRHWEMITINLSEDIWLKIKNNVHPKEWNEMLSGSLDDQCLMGYKVKVHKDKKFYIDVK